MTRSESHNIKKQPFVLGISASHNGGACLLRGNDIVVAIQEERLTRVKRKRVYASEPALAIQYCLSSAKIDVSDLDLIVICVQGSTQHPRQDALLNPQLKNKRDDVDIIYVSHHLCHAISAYATSGFSDSDLLVIDGIGSPYADLPDNERKLVPTKQNYWEGLSCYHAHDQGIKPVIKHMWRSTELRRPSTNTALVGTSSEKGLVRITRNNPSMLTHLSSVSIGSLGSMFEAVSLIIFGERLQAGKVMGLAAYGTATIPVHDFLLWEDGKIIYTSTFAARFKEHEIWPKHEREHQNLAASVQQALEYAVLKQIDFLRQRTQATRLCYAGGVALNTLLNERIIRESGYEQVFIIPAAEDSGTAIGAAYYGMWQLVDEQSTKALQIDSLGHHYSEQEVISSLKMLPGIHSLNNSPDGLDSVVEKLCNGNVGGWFQGGSELGPRALGQRSMICDPRTQKAKDDLNNQVKKREAFRPFAPIVLAEHAQNWFDFGDTDAHSPFMLRVANIFPHAKDHIPAVMHIDGSARVQTVTEENGLIYPLLQRFYAATGVPILLNTSLNVAGEPIVETPEDTWRCLQTTPLTFCMIGQQLILKKDNSQCLLDFIPLKTISRYAIEKQSNASQSLLAANIWAETPWGELRSKISIHHLYVLNEVDGKRTGLQIMQGLRKAPDNLEHRQNMLSVLAVLHQFHAIRFID